MTGNVGRRIRKRVKTSTLTVVDIDQGYCSYPHTHTHTRLSLLPSLFPSPYPTYPSELPTQKSEKPSDNPIAIAHLIHARITYLPTRNPETTPPLYPLDPDTTASRASATPARRTILKHKCPVLPFRNDMQSSE